MHLFFQYNVTKDEGGNIMLKTVKMKSSILHQLDRHVLKEIQILAHIESFKKHYIDLIDLALNQLTLTWHNDVDFVI